MRYSIALFFSLLAGTPAIAAAGGGIEGRWRTDDGKAIVTIAPCGTRMCGKIDKVLDTGPGVPRTDINNPDPKLRSRTILGLPILQNYRSSGGKWVDGKAYDPKTGSSYRSSLAVNPDGSLRVTGCVLFVCEVEALDPRLLTPTALIAPVEVFPYGPSDAPAFAKKSLATSLVCRGF